MHISHDFYGFICHLRNLCVYNGHYKVKRYKVATTESYNSETGIVPLIGNVIGINEDEGNDKNKV